MSKLSIVGTPIGNLQDITLRAIETLRVADIIACEDTRVTRVLLNALQIPNKKLIAYHGNNERISAAGIVKLLLEGKHVALVSDAGMPVISDPGFEAIRQAIGEELAVEVIPGPSAVLTALALSNFDMHFTFLGFLKPKTGQRQNQLTQLPKGTYVTFISVHKLLETLTDIAKVCGANTRLFLARELTKMHETHYRGTVTEIIELVKNDLRGEFTAVFEIIKK